MIGNRVNTAQKIAKKTFRKYHGHEIDINMNHYQNSQRRVNQIRGTYKKTKVPCSCECCGNPRKWFNEVTVKEKKSKDSFTDQLIGVY